jgi:hypothetical protein
MSTGSNEFSLDMVSGAIDWVFLDEAPNAPAEAKCFGRKRRRSPSAISNDSRRTMLAAWDGMEGINVAAVWS